ncbi:hypothetical protein J3458_021664 [Metarhizium acridum]|uniref:uncharacterized protein n=1 Tax=Metarhizium acridum TaxID=92637 RepID=UPI001C6CCE60|nr:hypothetical protein J3458_021664 [Metarhizium acridum]
MALSTTPTLESPCLIMRTRGQGDLSPNDDLDGVDTGDLRILLQLARQTTYCIETELAARSALSRLPTSVRNCIEKMHDTIQKLDVLQRLDDTAGLMSTAAKIMQNEQTGRREKIYKQFLIDIRDHCGPSTTLLCAKSLGKRRIVDLNIRERISLLSYLKNNSKTFQHPVLDGLALRLGVTGGKTAPLTNANTTNTEHQSVVERQIEYKYSEASIDVISMLGPDLANAVQASNQYKWERQTGGSTTDCIQGLTPRNRGDITLQLLLGFDEGTEVMEELEMQVV